VAGFGPGVRRSAAEVNALLDGMAYRGDEVRSVHVANSGFLGVARDEWETGDHFAGPTLVAERGHVRAVCDGSLYYRGELLDRLRSYGVEPHSMSTTDLVVSAYLAFGTDCVRHLEGDYAFCLWDAHESRLLCARDAFATRGLFYLQTTDGVIAASTPRALRACQGDAWGFDPEGVLRGLLLRPGEVASRTAWRGVAELPPAHLLVANSGGVRIERFWVPRTRSEYSSLNLEEAAEVCRQLLDEAVAERTRGVEASIALSGGMDSTAVFAAGRDAGADLHPISLQYPEGDSGDESWYVRAVTEQSGHEVEWIDVRGIPLFPEQTRRARVRANCHGHVFEGNNRALARAAHNGGRRVLLSGHGGDNVFGLGDWRMADLVRGGRLLAARSYGRERGYRGWRRYLAHAVRPALPYAVSDVAERVLGRRICSRPLERPVPGWIVAPTDLLDRVTGSDRSEHQDWVVRGYRSIVSRQRAWGMAAGTFGRANHALFDLNRDEGVELRLPFYDRRLIEFSFSLPPELLNRPGRWKVVLGESVGERLPDRRRSVQKGGLKPGTNADLVASRWEEEFRSFVDGLSGPPWRLDELGLVDVAAYRRVVDGGGVGMTGVIDLSLTAFVEAWLRAQDDV